MKNTADILTKEATEFLSQLHHQFGQTRIDLLNKRSHNPHLQLLKETAPIRESAWAVAPAAADLNDRRVEITGPVEAKMMINALNSGAQVFMADFEDSLSPTWNNILNGQLNLYRAVRRNLEYTSPEGKLYVLKQKLATLVVRPRGWHLLEENFIIDGEAISASLFDFGLYFFHNAQELLKRNSGPYFYLPKMESHLEARLWNDVFNYAQAYLNISKGTIRATVLIETIPAAFEMEEILFELKDHAAGLNAGRWDYIFSMIKKFSDRTDLTYPDRAQLTMTIPFMRAYTQRLVNTCHKRGAHAIGGMAAFIPSRKDEVVNQLALNKVREDKIREANDGFDGTWVAHPDLVPIARDVFETKLMDSPHQKHVNSQQMNLNEKDLLPQNIEGGVITPKGFSDNISVCLQYITAWLDGNGAVAINNLMEDAATAEISRAQLWQWVQHKAKTQNGTQSTPELFLRELFYQARLLPPSPRLHVAVKLLEDLVLSPELADFLTIPAYKILNQIPTHQINRGATNDIQL